MLKKLISTAILISAASVAHAQPFPAPPTKAYTAPTVSDCTNETLQVYFPAGTSALTPASREILKAANARLEGCILGPVSLNASAADARSDREAQTLSAARIETISDALSEYQLVGAQVQAAPYATDETRSLWAPMDRKVEIRLAAWSPEIS